MLGTGTWKHWDINFAEATWLVNSIKLAKHRGEHPQTKPPWTVGADEVSVAHTGKCWEGTAGCSSLGKRQ